MTGQREPAINWQYGEEGIGVGEMDDQEKKDFYSCFFGQPVDDLSEVASLMEQLVDSMRNGNPEDIGHFTDLVAESWERQVDADEWSRCLKRIDGAPRNRLIAGKALQIEPRSLNTMLQSAWKYMEKPSQFGRDRVTGWFHWAGYVTDDPDLQRPTEAIVIYRGTNTADRRAGRGLAWTTSLTTATFFANRPDLPGLAVDHPTLWRATISPVGILGCFTGRDEHEVVVNPRRLSNLKRVDPGVLIDEAA